MLKTLRVVKLDAGEGDYVQVAYHNNLRWESQTLFWSLS